MEGGQVTFSMTHCSDYIVTDAKLPAGITDQKGEDSSGYRRSCSDRILVFLRNCRHYSNQLYQTEKTRNGKIKRNPGNIKPPAVTKWLQGGFVLYQTVYNIQDA